MQCAILSNPIFSQHQPLDKGTGTFVYQEQNRSEDEWGIDLARHLPPIRVEQINSEWSRWDRSPQLMRLHGAIAAGKFSPEVKMETKQEEPKMGEGIFHPGVRPMKVYVDDDGIMYLCDTDIDPKQPLKEQACWTCDKVLFTRGG